MDINLPINLEFSPWYYWENRFSILESAPSDSAPTGIYCIAFSNRIKQGDPMNWEKVIYIGMSVRDGGLAGRWRELDRALRGNRGHSGGNYMNDRLQFVRLGGGGWKAGSRRVLVSAMVVPVPNELTYPEKMRKNGLVAYLEYEAFAQFSAARKRLNTPRFNNGGSGRSFRETKPQ